MDITSLFKACVKSVKTRSKALGIELGTDAYQTKILSTKSRCEFIRRAKELVNYLTKLKEFLLEHRKDYINCDHLISNSSRMTDNERDQIDTETQKFIKQCSQNIYEFRAQMSTYSGSSQILDHRSAVIALLEEYLKNICKIYSEQRAIRIKRIVDIQKLSKLECGNQQRKKVTTPMGDTPAQPLVSSTADERQTSATSLDFGSDAQSQPASGSEMPGVDSDLSADEIQMFEQENQKLYEEFNSLASEIKQIEGKVVEISKLQEIFAEKILEQEKDIDRVATTVIGTTENIKDANEEIREAMKKNAGFRVWILFFLLVLSFSLLFLDWYNP